MGLTGTTRYHILRRRYGEVPFWVDGASVTQSAAIGDARLVTRRISGVRRRVSDLPSFLGSVLNSQVEDRRREFSDARTVLGTNLVGLLAIARNAGSKNSARPS
jgi:hypothetical protein